jgi:hypothetical protein
LALSPSVADIRGWGEGDEDDGDDEDDEDDEDDDVISLLSVAVWEREVGCSCEWGEVE